MIAQIFNYTAEQEYQQENKLMKPIQKLKHN